MIFISAKFQVEDYEKWKGVFNADDGRRKEGGSLGGWHFYNDENKMVMVLMKWESKETFDAFFSQPEMKEKMAESGVVGEMDMNLWDESTDVAS